MALPENLQLSSEEFAMGGAILPLSDLIDITKQDQEELDRYKAEQKQIAEAKKLAEAEAAQAK